MYQLLNSFVLKRYIFKNNITILLLAGINTVVMLCKSQNNAYSILGDYMKHFNDSTAFNGLCGGLQ